MSGKLDRAIAEAEAENRSEELAAEVYVRERRALDEQIPAVWGKFRAAIKVKCEAKPKHLRFGVCPDVEAKVERLNDPKHRMLEVQLLRESGVVQFECGEASGCCTIRLNRQNIAGVCDQDGHPFLSIEDAAEEVLSLLFS
jgi:hypothetical protein